MTLGQRIQALRKQHRLSQEMLGEAVGVSRQAISKWEGDLTIPELEKLIALSRLFGLPVGVLLGVEEQEKEEGHDPGRSPAWSVRVLMALCIVLAVTSVLSLGCVLYFRHQVMEVLDPPTPPVNPAAVVEYDLEQNMRENTLDLALELILGEKEDLKGWEVTAEFSTTLWREKKNQPVRECVPVSFSGGRARVELVEFPYTPYRDVTAILHYTKGDLSAAQTLLKAQFQPLKDGWEITGTGGMVPKRADDLLK